MRGYQLRHLSKSKAEFRSWNSAFRSLRYKLTKSYFFAGAFAGAFFSGAFAAGAAVLASGTAAFVGFSTGAAFVSDGKAVFALVSTGTDVLAFVSDVLALADEVVSAGVSGFDESTEVLPVSAGIASSNADIIKVVAAPIVTFERTVAVPRGVKAELETLLVNKAPASVLPGCSNTEATSTMHERKNNPYKK